MRIVILAREAACSVPSTSGRGILLDILGRPTPELSYELSRSFASLVGSGIPSPRPDVALQLSTPHGGHINRMINASESLVELDSVLYKFRKRLRPANVGAASLKLAHLYRYEQAPKYSLKVRRMASELQKYVETFTDRLALTQVSNVVRGLSAVGHRLPPELVVRLAAGVLATGSGSGAGGSAVRLAPDVDVRDLCYGFAGQGYTNPLFWSRLCSAVQPRLTTFNPNTLPAIVQSLQAAQQLTSPPSPGTTAATAAAAVPQSLSDAAVSGSGGDATANATASYPQVAVARDALRLLSVSLERLQPTRLADTAQLLATVGSKLGVGVEPELLGQLEAMALRALPSLTSHPGHLANLLLGLRKLRSRAAATSLPTPTSPTSMPLQRPYQRLNPHQLSPEVVAAAVPHLRAAAPAMQLIHIKRSVEALAPSAVTTATADGALPAVLDLLARRATALLPPPPPGTAAGGLRPSELSAGILSRIPRGGKDAGLVLAVAAGPGMTRLDESLLGVLSGLAHAYAVLALAPPVFAAAVATQVAGDGDAAACGEESASAAATAATTAAEEDATAAAAAAAASWEALRRKQYLGVEALFERVAALALAGQQAGLLVPEQAAALGLHLSVLLPGPPPRRAGLVEALSGAGAWVRPAAPAVAGAVS